MNRDLESLNTCLREAGFAELPRGSCRPAFHALPEPAIRAVLARMGHLLDGSDWRWLLRERPEFRDVADFSKLAGWVWCCLLIDLPELADRCPWEKLDGGDWSLLLIDETLDEIERRIKTAADNDYDGNMAGYIYYPNVQGVIDLFTKLREIELELRRDCDK
jgi:hypothetical protein